VSFRIRFLPLRYNHVPPWLLARTGTGRVKELRSRLAQSDSGHSPGSSPGKDGSGFRVQGLGFRHSPGSSPGKDGSGFRVQGLGIAWGAPLERIIQGSEFRVQGLDIAWGAPLERRKRTVQKKHDIPSHGKEFRREKSPFVHGSLSPLPSLL
jgi:hypothetical protein